MKRSAALVPLSREHHTALSLARRIQTAAANGEALDECLMRVRHLQADLLTHFEQEESTLLPYMQQHAALAERLHLEHRQLRAHLQAFAAGEHAGLADFATLLSAHVRFEEREFFPAFEALATSA